jgi:hypothetical protein
MRRIVIPLLAACVACTLLLFDLTILRSGRTALQPTMQKGIALGIHRASAGMSYYRASLDEMAALGATHLSIPVYFFQDSVYSVVLFPNPTDGTPPEQHDRVVREVVEYAHRLGMKVLLAPIVDIAHPAGKAWRGVIAPKDWTAWFDSYRAFLTHYARMAEDLDVEFMSVGIELISTEHHTDQWLETIQAVRKVYRGQLTYSANWDHYQDIAFWDALDFLGVSGYFELTAGANPTVEDLVRGWGPVKKELRAWQARWNKPLLFVEIGYTSQEGAGSRPWDYTARAPLNLEEQRRCYEALRRAWENEPDFAGLYLWIWEPDKRGANDAGYAFAGKPAEAVVRAWYRSAPSNATVLDRAIHTVERFFQSLRQGL